MAFALYIFAHSAQYAEYRYCALLLIGFVVENFADDKC